MRTVERTLAIFAHPDDIAWTGAGTIAHMTDEGEEVDQIMVTSGGYGGDESKKNQRLEEEQISMNILRMGELFPLDFPDGELSEEMFNGLVSAILRVIDNAQQRGIVYRRLMSFGSEDGFSGHPDHKLVARAVEYAFGIRDQIKELAQVVMSPDEQVMWPNSWFLGEQQIDVPRPSIVECRAVDISGTIFQKTEAIRAHTSQMGGDNGGSVQIRRVLSTEPVEHWRVYTRP